MPIKRGSMPSRSWAYEIPNQKLTDYEAETTVNVGACSGGTKPNVVLAEAEIEIDCRKEGAAEGDRIRKAINDQDDGSGNHGVSRRTGQQDADGGRREANMALLRRRRSAARRSGLSFPGQVCGRRQRWKRGVRLWVSRPLDGLGAAGDGRPTCKRVHPDRTSIFREDRDAGFVCADDLRDFNT